MVSYRSRKDGSHYPLSRRVSTGTMSKGTAHLSVPKRITKIDKRRTKTYVWEDYRMGGTESGLIPAMNTKVAEKKLHKMNRIHSGARIIGYYDEEGCFVRINGNYSGIKF